MQISLLSLFDRRQDAVHGEPEIFTFHEICWLVDYFKNTFALFYLKLGMYAIIVI